MMITEPGGRSAKILKGLAAIAKTTFTFHFSIINAEESILQC